MRNLSFQSRRRRGAVGRVLPCILVAIAGAWPAALSAKDLAGRPDADMLRYERSFNTVRDTLAAAEAAGSTSAAPKVWTSPGDPPKGAVREVPASAYTATVAHPSAGSWREAGDACVMSAAGTVRILGSSPRDGTLVRFERSSRIEDPSACADGTVAFVPTERLFAWPDVGSRQAERRAVGERLAASADRILSGQPTD